MDNLINEMTTPYGLT